MADQAGQGGNWCHCWGVGGGGRGSFWKGVEMFAAVMVMLVIVQRCEYSENQGTVYFLRVNCMVCEFHLSP